MSSKFKIIQILILFQLLKIYCFENPDTGNFLKTLYQSIQSYQNYQTPILRIYKGLIHHVKCQICEMTPLKGMVGDCKCDFDSVSSAAIGHFVPMLSKLTRRNFFRYFRVDLNSECPFWEEFSQCSFDGACSVGVCDITEVPLSWRDVNDKNSCEDGWIVSSTLSAAKDSKHSYIDSERVKELSSVSTSQVKNQYENFLKDLRNQENWTLMPEYDDDAEGVYVNLLQNPERYTGYSGTSANRVWKAIMEENCFSEEGLLDSCFEKRVFFRLMSGLRASIAVHISKDYYFQDKNIWGINFPLFIKAVGGHKERIENLYFSFLFLLRSITKAQEALSNYHYNTGNVTEDSETLTMVRQFLVSSSVQETSDNILSNKVEECANGFDESQLFQFSSISNSQYWNTKTETNKGLYDDFRDKFRNVTKIMNCVSCEKCKVWGKLQILGIATSIKLLLSSEKEIQDNFLSRQEIISLINTLHQFASSVQFVATMSEMEFSLQLQSASLIKGALFFSIFVSLVIISCIKLTSTFKIMFTKKLFN